MTNVLRRETDVGPIAADIFLKTGGCRTFFCPGFFQLSDLETRTLDLGALATTMLPARDNGDDARHSFLGLARPYRDRLIESDD